MSEEEEKKIFEKLRTQMTATDTYYREFYKNRYILRLFKSNGDRCRK